ncbi:hypothetical protein F3J37_25500 [Pantoea sp. Al-1710]|uniref:Uncharacterized protein n=1 Tax=Candidatus Pantoea communis TaxID=2608354 RepID=A0ABX0RY42_9GAMM|nr:hypothetical protein [Pantoea communis]NIG22024.1 hypothetical protein [Pantoea communis]
MLFLNENFYAAAPEFAEHCPPFGAIDVQNLHSSTTPLAAIVIKIAETFFCCANFPTIKNYVVAKN